MSVKFHYPAFLSKKQRELGLGGVTLRDGHFLSSALALQISRGRKPLQHLIHGFLDARIRAMELAGRLRRQLAQFVAVLYPVKSSKNLV
jgi:hypothetical protein